MGAKLIRTNNQVADDPVNTGERIVSQSHGNLAEDVGSVSQYPHQNVEYMATNRISAASTLNVSCTGDKDLPAEYRKLSSKRNDRTGKIESLIELLQELNYCNPEVELGDDYLTYSSEERLSYVFNGLHFVAQADNGDVTEKTYHAAMATLALLVYSEPVGSPISISACKVYLSIYELVNDRPLVVMG